METKNNIPAFYASSTDQWRKWLEENAASEKTVLLIMHNKKSSKPCISYEQSVEQALCFGWIDNKAMKRDEESSYLTFSLRKPGGNWSNTNKVRVERMIKQGLMTPAGQAFIDIAKKTGTWDRLTDAQNTIIPDDLQKMFDQNAVALSNFSAFPPSSRRLILEWVSNAKKQETREKRMIQTVELASRNVRANH
jgi:uncharacterized protein YdeI (YjbR/CyaY-like superfamily)